MDMKEYQKISIDKSGFVRISGSAPERIWAMTTVEKNFGGDGIPEIDMNLLSYVRDDLISKEERERIRGLEIGHESKNLS